MKMFKSLLTITIATILLFASATPATAATHVPVVAPIDSSEVNYFAFTPGTIADMIPLGKSVKQGEAFSIPVLDDAEMMGVMLDSDVSLYVSSDFTDTDYILIQVDITTMPTDFVLAGLIIDGYSVTIGDYDSMTLYAYAHPGTDLTVSLDSYELGLKDPFWGSTLLPEDADWEQVEGEGEDGAFTVTLIESYAAGQIPDNTEAE